MTSNSTHSAKNGDILIWKRLGMCSSFCWWQIQKRFLETDTISWVGKRPPPDEPPCGYLYEKCRGEGDNRLRNSRISAGVLGGIFLLVILCTVYAYRKWKVEQEIAGLVWKIDSNELFDTTQNMDRSTSKVMP